MRFSFQIIIIAALLVCIEKTSAQGAVPSGIQKYLRQRSDVNLEQINSTTITIQNTMSGEKIYKSIESVTQNNTPDLLIDLSTLDTLQYSSRYRLWRDIPIGNGRHGMTVADINRNAKKEIYSARRNFVDTETRGIIYEYNFDSTFKLLKELPDTISPGFIYTDVDADGKTDMIYYYDNRKLLLLTQKDTNDLPITFKSLFDTTYTSGQPIRINFYDMDSDGQPELIYYLDFAGGEIFPPSNQIAKYNLLTNKFDVVYFNQPNRYNGGLVFGDFDQDGKQNFATGGINGELFMYEHVAGNTYQMKLVDTIPTKNAYLCTKTNDLDGNGKPEIWMGGDSFSNGIGITRIVLYEASGNDTYQRKYQIDIRGVFSFFAGNMTAADMDNDGKEEVILCVDQHVFIFKNTGGNNYTLWYVKKNDFALAGHNSVFYVVTVADFDNDKLPEIIIGMDEVKYGLRFFSKIYKADNIVSVQKEIEQIPLEFYLHQNYPNPFNGQTRIQYQIPQMQKVTITIYNILGKEIIQYNIAEKQAGRYEIVWDAKNMNNEEVPSGLYFITIRAGTFSKTIKSLLIR